MALPEFTMRGLLESGVHFGHQKYLWNPRMAPFIFGVRNGLHILDLSQTVPLLRKALGRIRDTVAKGGRVLIVGTKRQAQDPVAKAAERCAQYYVNARWLGGMLTNWKTVSQSIKTLRALEETLSDGASGLTKKELLNIQRRYDKLERNLGGIRHMGGIPDLLCVIDVNQDAIAVAEAKCLGIPVVGILDSNSAPEGVTYPIPGNDDARRAIELYCDLFAAAALDGLSKAQGGSGVDRGASEEVPVDAELDRTLAQTMDKKMETEDMETQVDAGRVKALRSKTGAGMMDCKKALQACSGDSEAAVQWLREKGLSQAAKKADRVAAEGLVSVVVEGGRGVVVEVNAETDFVARNETFQKIVQDITSVALSADGSREKILSSPYPDANMRVEEKLVEAVATIGENIALRRADALSVEQGAVASYIHNAVSDGLGKIGVLVALESSADQEVLQSVGRQIAMHVAAATPLAVRPEDLDPAVLEKERAVYSAQARESGKPEQIIEKMVEGRIRKFYQESTLLKQNFVVNPEITVEEALSQESEKCGAPIRLTGFIRYALGEGVEKS